jgi:hypothetical protein
MNIVKGPNLYVSKGEVSDLLGTPTSDLVWKRSHNDQHIISVHMQACSFYYLVRSNVNVKDVVGRRSGVMSDFVDKLLGYISVDHGDLDTIDAVWLTPSMRGKGYGDGLYRLAYQMSERGIRSSTELGTPSLATLIRLYKKEYSMGLVYDDMGVPRDQVQAEGADMWWGNLNLCDPETGDFRFHWRK